MSASDPGSELASELLRQRICLYLYGELSLAERRQVDRLRRDDPAFARLFEEEESFLLAVGDAGVDECADAMLGDCRDDLAIAIAAEEAQVGAESPLARIRRWFRSVAGAAVARPLAWQPAVAALLLLVGFAAGRGTWGGWILPGLGPVQDAASEAVAGASPVAAGVETVHLDPARGQVRIVFEERRVVSGDSADPVIRSMLMDSARESHAGARLASLEALHRHAADNDVRRILLRAMLEDQNVGVRLRALDAVREHASNADVREALVRMLRTDPLAGMRIHAIQILGEHPGRDLAGVLQELVEREQNPFVVQESERILDSLDASMERF